MTVWLLTWLWQGLALTTLVALVMRLELRVINAPTRHLIWWSVLAGVIWLGWTSSPYEGLTPLQVRMSDPTGAKVAPEPLFYAPSVAPLLISAFLGVWVAIALMKLVRLVPSLHALYALRDRCRPFPAQIEARLPLWLESQAGGRRAELVLCDAVPGATVLGFDRPYIALPTSLVEALSAEEIDQIVLHEYAHVQRRDDWMRLVQRLVEAVLWIHPAVAYIGRALNREREMACDEWVVARTGLPKVYARCLTHAAEVRGRIAAPLLGTGLFATRHDLVRRVDRLLAARGRMRRRVSALSTAAAACAIGVTSVQLSAVPLVGHYIETSLPGVAAPLLRATASLRPAAISDVLEAAPPIVAVSQSRVQNGPDRPLIDQAHQPAAEELSAQSGSDDTTDPEDAREPVMLSARVIHGAYVRETSAPSLASPNNPWRAAGVPGVEVAKAARKTGVGLANAFSRAGMTLAGSF